MIGATLKFWRSRAMHVIVEGVGAKSSCLQYGAGGLKPGTRLAILTGGFYRKHLGIATQESRKKRKFILCRRVRSINLFFAFF